MWLLIVLIVLIACWGGGYWVGPEPIRGNSLLHGILVLVVFLLVVEFLTGGSVLSHHRWSWR